MRAAVLGLAVLSATLGILATPGIAGRSTDRHWCRHLPRWTAYYAGSAVGVHRLNDAGVDCYRGEGGLGPDGDVSYLYGDCHDFGETATTAVIEPTYASRPR